jgi:2-polyprenyl-3-methyl-5-hydroxy-6-metoxy-1,4-benzoquinol methylase
MNCPICKRNSTVLLAERLRRGDGRVYYCKNCDLGYLENFIEDVQTYYDQEYRRRYSHKAVSSETNPQELFDMYSKFQDERVNIIRPYLKVGRTKLLEIGASAGMFLQHMKGLCAAVNAIEFDRACCEFIEKTLNISTDSNSLEESIFFDNQYDVVCSFQVLEHTKDPIKYLNNVYKALSPGGHLFIEIPNLHDPLLSLWDVEYYKQFYYHSAHNYYFSEKSIGIIVAHTEFELANVEFTQDYNLLNHINWILNNKPQETCEIGLNEPKLLSVDSAFNDWFNKKLNRFNREYFAKLKELRKTSNMMIVLKKPLAGNGNE